MNKPEPEAPELIRLRNAVQRIAKGYILDTLRRSTGEWYQANRWLCRFDMQAIANEALQGKRNATQGDITELGRLQHVLTRIAKGYDIERVGDHQEVHGLSCDDMQVIAQVHIASER